MPLSEGISSTQTISSTEETTCDPLDDLANHVDVKPPWMDDGWEMGETLLHIERVLQMKKPVDDFRPVHRIDDAHTSSAPHHLPTRKPSKSKTSTTRKSRHSWFPLLSWTVLALGLMGTTCGVVLLIWSFVTGRQDLWDLGMPITLGGQAVLLVVFVLQLDQLWSDNRRTVAKLDDVDHRLDDLHTTTSLLGTTHSSSAVDFYSHMAGGANSHLLLADLKSQLDLLALKVGEEQQ